MKRILKSPIAVWLYILFAFTAGAITGAKISNKEFMSWDIKPDREYIAFEVKRIAEETPILNMRNEQLLKAFEKFQYQVDRVTILQGGKRISIVLEEEE